MRNRFSICLVTAAVCTTVLLAASASEADVDWRAKGVVTPVKNTGSPAFDASWAFAVTGAVEGEHAVEKGVLISLSEQELIDCVAAAEGDACADLLCGQAPCGLDYAVDHGLCAESSYPYTARSGSCKTCTPVATLGGWSRVTPGDENALIAAIDQSPVIARLEVGDHGVPLSSYTNYSGGVFSSPSFDDTAHQWVLIVGYGTNAGQDYYIVKNSLGTSWGASGYLYLARGGDELGVADNAYSPAGTTAHGACALPDGSCADMSSAACLTAGGTYGGDLSFCPAACSGCDADTTPPVIQASASFRPAKAGRHSFALTVSGKATDNCTIDSSSARYWVAHSGDPRVPTVTTPIVLDDDGSFTFPVSFAVTFAVIGPERGNPKKIVVSVKDLAGNERTVSLDVR